MGTKMLNELNQADIAERDEIIEEIHWAFGGQGRSKDAVSWNESTLVDNNRSDAECLAARKTDTDTHWSQLIKNPDWHPFPGIGGFAFLNVEGCQYYLPAVMVRFLEDCEDPRWYTGHLMHLIDLHTEHEKALKWSPRQLRSIARFIAFMSIHDENVEMELELGEPNPWAEALDERWRQYLQGS